MPRNHQGIRSPLGGLFEASGHTPPPGTRKAGAEKGLREIRISPCFCSSYCCRAGSCRAPRPGSSCKNPSRLQGKSRLGEAGLLLLPAWECREWVCALVNPGNMPRTRTTLDCTIQQADGWLPCRQCARAASCTCVCAHARVSMGFQSKVQVSCGEEIRQWTWGKALRMHARECSEPFTII